jgi:NTE family protein
MKNGRRIGLALAGGGPLGAVYEIGALAALADSLPALALNALHTYVGVSAGAFVAAGLANAFTPADMCRLFIESDEREAPFSPQIMMRPALREYAHRLRRLPPLAAGAAWQALFGKLSWLGAAERIGGALPTGVFSSDEIESKLAQLFQGPGRSNDFRQLAHRLVLVATDLDTGRAVEFGNPGLDDVPIARAVRASAALPGLFPPVQIKGRSFVDGALQKTLHASVALRAGCDLVLCINPLVPFDANLDDAPGSRPGQRIVDGGLPMVLSQTFRSLIRSRMEVGLSNYDIAYPGADVLLFEPDRRDAELFFTNVFSYANRRRLCEYAYQRTRQQLLRRRHELAPVLARHGLAIDVRILRDPGRRLVSGQPGKGRLSRLEGTLQELSATLADLERWLEPA